MVKTCGVCSFNHQGKCIVICERNDRMSDGKQAEYQSYLSIESRDSACEKFKAYVTRLRDANK